MVQPARPAALVARRALLVLELHHAGELDAGRLSEVLAAMGEQPAPRLGDAEVRAFTEHCGDFRALLALESVDDWAHALNAMLERWTVRPRLQHEGVGWHLHADREGEDSWARWFASSTTLAFAIIVAETGRRVGGLCQATDCGRPFLDTGPGVARRYCSPRCASRSRVARHRSRQGAPD